MFEPGIWYSVIKLDVFYMRVLFCDCSTGMMFVGMMCQRRDSEGNLFSVFVDTRQQHEHFPIPTHFSLLPEPITKRIPKEEFNYLYPKKPLPPRPGEE